MSGQVFRFCVERSEEAARVSLAADVAVHGWFFDLEGVEETDEGDGECEECGTAGVDPDVKGADGRSVCDACRDAELPPVHLRRAGMVLPAGARLVAPDDGDDGRAAASRSGRYERRYHSSEIHALHVAFVTPDGEVDELFDVALHHVGDGEDDAAYVESLAGLDRLIARANGRAEL